MADIRIGISGWRYAAWRGTFYPRGWRQARELEYAAHRMNSVEINGSFYSLQRPESYRAWYEQTPEGFLFAVKGGRFITHMKRLGDVETPLANFFASGVLRLGEKLGPILWQLPPGLRFDPERLASFFDRLPRDTRSAAALARRHDRRVRGRSWTAVEVEHPLRHAIEVRHESFRDPAFVELLRRHGVGLVVADTAGRWPFMEDVTADFVYVRLHGDVELYVSGYGDVAIGAWATKIRAWARGLDAPAASLVGPPAPARSSGRDVYAYFDNDVKVRAPFDAMALAHRLGLGPDPGRAPEVTPPAAAPTTARSRWPGFGRRRRAARRGRGTERKPATRGGGGTARLRRPLRRRSVLAPAHDSTSTIAPSSMAGSAAAGGATGAAALEAGRAARLRNGEKAARALRPRKSEKSGGFRSGNTRRGRRLPIERRSAARHGAKT